MKTESYTRSLLGIIIIGIGIGFLLDALNVITFSGWIADWWPLIIIAVGIVSLVSNPRVKLWPMFIIGAGVLLQFRELGALEFNVWSIIWPSALILLGLSFMFERLGPHPKETKENEIDMFTAFSGIDAKNKSNDFRGGKLSVMFGGISLDMREATIKDRAVIDTFSAFGGVELRVPEDWSVQTSGLPLFGGWEDRTKKPDSKKAPVLLVRGTCIFGGVEIKN